ncbi:SLAP domain-containing protein [Oceanobacillus halotolerans]|uniref:SLAP domain-containing protein n=1 Tax=Oceanobacillus halotolerans TaxID=2663380 RepID=UPI0013DC172E|nr:SLAP domain-containing protein [Oceanobacillus halotolerans]
MQQLQFEAVWDRTISNKDRAYIERAFQETTLSATPSIQFSALWHAINHKGELLVTALVHNTGQTTFQFHQQQLRYYLDKNTVATHTFTITSMKIQGQTSMPWTFIFPIGSFDSNVNYMDDQFRMKEMQVVKAEMG